MKHDKHHNPIEIGSWVLTRTGVIGQIIGLNIDDDGDEFFIVKNPNDPTQYLFFWHSIELISVERAMLGILEQ